MLFLGIQLSTPYDEQSVRETNIIFCLAQQMKSTWLEYHGSTWQDESTVWKIPKFTAQNYLNHERFKFKVSEYFNI